MRNVVRLYQTLIEAKGIAYRMGLVDVVKEIEETMKKVEKKMSYTPV